MIDKLKEKGFFFSWGNAEHASFEKLKVEIALEPLLVVVNPCKPFVVETNASATTVGAVLC